MKSFQIMRKGIFLC